MAKNKIEPDIFPPAWGEPLITGWTFNSAGLRVNRACTSYNSHNSWSETNTTTQGAISLYSTKELAIEACIQELEEELERKKTKIRVNG